MLFRSQLAVHVGTGNRGHDLFEAAGARIVTAQDFHTPRYIWWQTPEEALVRPQRVLARVMDLGVWEDWIRMAELFPPDALADILDDAEIGQFSARSWSFWHCRLDRELSFMLRRIVQ